MTVHLGLFQKSETDPLLEPLREAPEGQTYVIAQLGQSLDGRIATPTGKAAGSTGAQRSITCTGCVPTSMPWLSASARSSRTIRN